MRRCFIDLFLVCLALLVAACSSRLTPAAMPSPTGPPAIDYALVRQHALQFDVDVPSRPPGSQHELAAATYILGHLQFAGYVPVLEAVPVANQVQSTNVVALPPNGEDPEIVVAVGYDNDGRGPGEGSQIGLFLELARALNVAAPEHRVAFVALGAEEADHSGSVGLARTLEDYGSDGQVVVLGGPAATNHGTHGACAREGFGELVESIQDCGEGFVYEWLDEVIQGQTHVAGAPERVGDALLQILRSTAH